MNKQILVVPQDLEAEQAVLGSIIIDNNLMIKVVELLKPKSFSSEQNQNVFKAMLELAESSEPIDEILIGDRLKEKGKLEEVGGYPYLAELIDCAPSSGNIVYYARIIQEHALLRDLIETANQISIKSKNPKQNVSELLNEAENKIKKIASSRRGSDVVHIKDVLNETYAEIEELSKNPSDIVGLKTGFHKLDKLTCGLCPGDYILVAARPSMGKTSFALNIAQHVALNDKKPGAVYISTLETKNKKLAKRMLSSSGNISSYFLKTGNLVKSQQDSWDRLAYTTGKLSQTEIYFNDRSKNIDDIMNSARSTHIKLNGGLKLFITDYIQIVHGSEGGSNKNREREIAEISSKLNDLSNDLNIPVIALSQLNRALENRPDKHPQTSDLRDSGSLEQDADIIIFIYRDDVYQMKIKKNYQPTNIAEIIVEKNRDGPRGIIELSFDGKYTKFSNIEIQQSF